MSLLTATEIAEMRADFVGEGRSESWEYRQRSGDAWGSWTAVALLVTGDDSSELVAGQTVYLQRIVTAHPAEAVSLQLGDQLRKADETATVFAMRESSGRFIPRWTLVNSQSLGVMPGDDAFLLEGDA